MASKRHRRVPAKAADRPRKDRVFSWLKAQMEQRDMKEAEMEARVQDVARTITVVCPTCKQRSEFEVRNGVPVAACPACATRVPLRTPGNPEVATR